MRTAGHPPPDAPGAQASTQGAPHQQHNQGCTDQGRGTGSHPHPDPHGLAHGPPHHMPSLRLQQAHTQSTTRERATNSHNTTAQRRAHNTREVNNQWQPHEQEQANGNAYANKQSTKQ